MRSVMTFSPSFWTLSRKDHGVALDSARSATRWSGWRSSSALAGTVMMAVVGFKLPGLEFENQRVEAAFRKELL